MKTFTHMLVAILAIAWGPSDVARAECSRPNVVLIISDDQAWTDFGFMGHEHIETPHLDRLARQSLTYTRGYVPSSLCRPSLATLITGLYPHQHKISGNDPLHPTGLRSWEVRDETEEQRRIYSESREKLIRHIDRLPTLPRLLGERGYLGHQSGKWWEGGYARGGFTHGMTRGSPEPDGRHGDAGLAIGREGMQPIFEFIDDAASLDKPFFVWYAPFLPHTPHNPPERLLNKYLPKTDSEFIAKYWAMCEWFDETCGSLLGHLNQRGLAEETIVLFVTDNGWIQKPRENGYAARSKQSPNEGGTRTPIMIRWPGRVQPCWDARTLVSSIDLAPTILAACGLAPTGQMQGLNLLDRNALAQRRTIYGEIFEHDVADIERPAASLYYRWCIEGRYKLIWPTSASHSAELYDLFCDPHEQSNLARCYPQLVAYFKCRTDIWWRGR